RTVQPARQQAAAHGGLATVDHRLQGVVTSAGEVGIQFQIAAARAVQYDGVVKAFVAQAAQVRQGSALGFFGVAEQATRGTDGQGQVLAAKTLQVLGGELLAEAFERRVPLEIPRRAATYTTALFGR